ncbi:MAG: hypothetical protein OXI54_01705 [Chloroflexota bacterium]|nr:hypothetical protein [Chloroflexota bacterium]MDE2682850.1 hypothetical protein [Chloroflexota bacterium]
MTTTSTQDQVDEIFADASRMYAQAVERLEQDDIRDAAEKAWCATKRATDALILALMHEEPGPTGFTSDCLDDLVASGRAPNSLQRRYYSRLSQLHGACFYTGACNRHTERRIRETDAYIADAEALAGQ